MSIEVIPGHDAEASNFPSSRMTPWSLLTFVLAIPLWWLVLMSGVMNRIVDGGIFLSVIGGLDRGLPLYAGVWDNKDPLFFIAMWGAGVIHDVGPFVMDWLWIPLASFGAWLIARGATSADRALAIGLIVTPFILIGPAYMAGWTNTPGTALTLLALGFVMARLPIPAGITLGILAFTKLVIWPIALTAVVLLIFLSPMRKRALMTILWNGLSAIVIAGLLFIAGWLGPYLDAQARNQAYASDAMQYFGFDPSWIGHLGKLRSDAAGSFWLTVITVLALVMAGLIAWGMNRSDWESEKSVVVLWSAWCSVGVGGILALTYVWPHHVQMLALPAVMAASLFTVLIPRTWHHLAALLLLLPLAWILGGWGTPSAGIENVAQKRQAFPVLWEEIQEVPKDARILEVVPASTFTYARLGTNDDRGYLLSARKDASLACPQFHLYDFSPDVDFADMLDCIQDVDVVILTDNFVVFGNGGKAAAVRPILDYIAANFTCLRIEDRQLCSRFTAR
jgi:hypothetical protein